MNPSDANTLGELLRAHGIEPLNSAVIRHGSKKRDPKYALPYLFEEERPVFEFFQSIQFGQRAGLLDGSSHLISSLGIESGRALFLGVYEVVQKHDAALPSLSERDEYQRLVELGLSGDLTGSARFDLKPIPVLGNYSGRIVFRWNGSQTWARRMQVNLRSGMQILDVARDSIVPQYRQYNAGKWSDPRPAKTLERKNVRLKRSGMKAVSWEDVVRGARLYRLGDYRGLFKSQKCNEYFRFVDGDIDELIPTKYLYALSSGTATSSFTSNDAKYFLAAYSSQFVNLADINSVARGDGDRLAKNIAAAMDDPEARRIRLAAAPAAPKKSLRRVTYFHRSADVIVEVLVRAAGACEECRKPAPFIRRSNQTPYLEVHHKVPLAEGGDDTVDNAVALCPNCHRYAHYG